MPCLTHQQSSRGGARVRASGPEAFRAEVAYWVKRLRVRPRSVRVQKMTRKWGSCSAAGTVTFATALLAEPAEFRTYVIVHELLHLRVPNHGRLFKSYLGAYVPGYQRYWTDADGLRDAC